MNENNFQQPVYNQVQPPKEKNKNGGTLALILGIVLVLCVGAGWLYINVIAKDDKKDDSKDKTKEEVSSSAKIDSKKVRQLVDDSYYSELNGKDIIDFGVNDKSKLILAANKYHYDNYDEIMDDANTTKKCSTLFENNKYAKKIYKDIYTVKYGDLEFTCPDEITFLSYNKVNEYYKKMFNEDAPKITVYNGVGAAYYYSDIVDGYLVPEFAIGCVVCDKHAYNIKEYKEVDGKLVVSINYITFTMDYNEGNEKNPFKLTLDKDTKATYEFDGDNFDDIVSDAAKNHSETVEVYNFIYKIDGDNYYLESIKKA